MTGIRYELSPSVSSGVLNELFSRAWDGHTDRDYSAVLERSLVYVCAFSGDSLVGFANVAWDGGVHGFLLDPTVHPEFRRQGIGSEMIRRAAAVSEARGLEWLHVDYEPHLGEFYDRTGFRSTEAGLMKLKGCDAG